jgi:hypothetical protein
VRSPHRFSELSAPRQALLRLFQSTNYGYLQDLIIRDREPILKGPHPVVFADVRLDVEERSRDELSLPDFVLCAEFTRLLSILNEIANGEISKIEIRGGVPRRITIRKSPPEVLGGLRVRCRP